jgi:PAS domain S-box-containing protein
LVEHLKERDGQHRALFETTPNPIWTIGLEGDFVACNHAAEAFSGYSCESILTKNLRDFLPRELVDSVLESVLPITTCGGVLEMPFAIHNGDVRYLEMTVIPSSWNAKPVFFGIGKDITDRKRAEQALRKDRDDLERRVAERTTELREVVDRLQREVRVRTHVEKALKKEQQLLRRLLTLQEQDRKLVAYEIHDGFTQEVTGAQLLLGGFRDMLSNRPDEAWKTFDTAVHLLGQSIAEARQLISGLRPPVLDESGVVGAIDHLIYEAQRRSPQRIEFEHAADAFRFAPPLESAVFRIAQECLTNACRHSQSDRIVIRLARHGRRVRLEVQDWGQGFVPKDIPSNHFGIRGIRERARLLGGRVAIRTAPRQGTHIIVDLPYVKQAGEPTAAPQLPQ